MERKDGDDYKRTSETSGGDGYAHYLVCGDGFTGGYLRHNSPNFTF